MYSFRIIQASNSALDNVPIDHMIVISHWRNIYAFADMLKQTAKTSLDNEGNFCIDRYCWFDLSDQLTIEVLLSGAGYNPKADLAEQLDYVYRRFWNLIGAVLPSKNQIEESIVASASPCPKEYLGILLALLNRYWSYIESAVKHWFGDCEHQITKKEFEDYFSKKLQHGATV